MRELWLILRAVIVAYPITFLVVRVLGKKQISTMTFWDVVSAIALGSLAANMVTNQQVQLMASSGAVLLWGAITLATDWFVLKARGFRRLVQGIPRAVIVNGQVQEAALRRERMNLDLLRSALRTQGAFSIQEVAWAILEPNGKVTVQKRSQDQAPTRNDLKLPGRPGGPSVAVILEGRICEEGLRAAGVDRHWLEAELAKQRVTDPRTVFYAEHTPDGSLHLEQFASGSGSVTRLI